MEKSDRINTYQYKLRESKFDELNTLGALLIDDHMDAFKKTYGNLLAILLTKEDTRLVLTFAQFYDPIMHCFTFQDILLAPTLEEFAYILCIHVKYQVPYMSANGFPEPVVIAQTFYLKREVVNSNIHTKGNTRGFPSKFLIKNTTLFTDSGSWDAFYANFSLLIYGLVLFPIIEGFIDKVAINIFLTKNQVPTLLADVYFSFHWRNKKNDEMISLCVPLLYKWFLTHSQRK
ncbi:uncharacterized protein LOC127130731 [Lathyrus oleraceus]|uniref:uncharacterized protein LOC127130731 n=1 Tax=Pisum sativum TaxID=3888 RepID=UPI0021D343CF|nr:uncharacterized protein LOC127130731 [Pisum sativum]